MTERKSSLEDIRDRGGLIVLDDVAVGRHIDFYGVRLLVSKVDVDPRNSNEDSPCFGCYFYDHPICIRGLKQCACFKYCTSPHRSDRKSVIFQVDMLRGK